MALLSGVDANNMLQNIDTTHLIDRVLAAAKSDPDIPTLMEALMGGHGEEFRAAIVKEMNALKNRKTCTLIPKRNLSEFIKVISTTWAMKIKRFPNGTFRSFKARFCVRGDLQKK
eukprot:3380947-Ditylum_brightwellii.AAC.1